MNVSKYWREIDAAALEDLVMVWKFSPNFSRGSHSRYTFLLGHPGRAETTDLRVEVLLG